MVTIMAFLFGSLAAILLLHLTGEHPKKKEKKPRQVNFGRKNDDIY